MFKAKKPTLGNLEDYLTNEKEQLVTLSFVMTEGERAFTRDDADFAHALANLPDRGRLPLAFVSGALSGADLALALICPFIAIEYGASLSTGFGRPGSAAIYIAAARRIGSVACEKLLFGASVVTADAAEGANLANAVASLTDALSLADQRISTMISVARANLVTWPMPFELLQALID